MLVEYTGTAEYAMMQPSVSDGAGIRMAVEAGAATTNELFVEVSEKERHKRRICLEG